MDAIAEVTDPSATPDSDADPILEAEPHMHIRTFKLQVLKVGAFIVRHGRYITFRIAHTAVQAWKQFWGHFQKLHWQALPDS